MSSFILKNVNLDCRSKNLHIVPLKDRWSSLKNYNTCMYWNSSNYSYIYLIIFATCWWLVTPLGFSKKRWTSRQTSEVNILSTGSFLKKTKLPRLPSYHKEAHSARQCLDKRAICSEKWTCCSFPWSYLKISSI